MLSKYRKFVFSAFLIATLLSILGGGQRFLIRELHQAGAAPRYGPIVFEFSYWYVWAGCLLPALWLAARLPVGREHWGRSVTVQAFLSVVFAFAHLALHGILLGLILPDYGLREALQGNLIAKISQRVLVYSAVIIGCYAYNFRLRYRREAMRGLHLESQLALTQMQTLKNHFHPSSIFSVLFSIRSFLRCNVETADSLTARLGDFLRLSLESSGQRMVPLQQELEKVGAYIHMEEMRLQRRIRLRIEVDPEAADASVPNSVLLLTAGAFLDGWTEEQSPEGSVSIYGVLIPPEDRTGAQQQLKQRLMLTVRNESIARPPALQDVLGSLKSTLEEAYESGFECNWGRDSAQREWLSLILPLSLVQETQLSSRDAEQELSSAGLDQLQRDVEQRERRFLDEESGIWPKVVMIFGLWTVIVLVQFLQGMVTLSLEGREIQLFRMAIDYAAWYSWAVCTPLVLYFGRTFPLEGERRSRNLFIHFLLSMGFGIGMVFFYTGWRRWMGLVDDPQEEARLFVQYPYVIDMMVYFAILGAREAIRYNRKSLEGELRSAKLKADLAHAQLQALKMQLHPHFLFNTLNSLSELMHEDAQAAETMLDRLQDFLRMTLEAGELQEIPLGKELEFLQDYLAIQQMRFQDRLAVDFHIDPRTVSDRVPNLILQPIVENAIRHGIASRTEAGRIEIRSSHENGNLCLQIRDDGPGILSRAGDWLRLNEGIGLSNTRARLAQLYGESHAFDMTNSPGGGLLVTVQIPIDRTTREVK